MSTFYSDSGSFKDVSITGSIDVVGSLKTGLYTNASGQYSMAQGVGAIVDSTVFIDVNTITYIESNDFGNTVVSSTTSSVIVEGNLDFATPYVCDYLYIENITTGLSINTNFYSRPIVTSISYDSFSDRTTLNFSPPLSQVYYAVDGDTNRAKGSGSHAEGFSTYAYQDYSHAEGYNTIAIGTGSHAEGFGNTAHQNYSHAEGQYTNARAPYSHAEGVGVQTFAIASHAEGRYTVAYGESSHAEGNQTNSSGSYSHAEGAYTISIGGSSHAEGVSSISRGEYSHAEGNGGIASGSYSHAEGSNTRAIGAGSHAEGNVTYAVGDYSHAEGTATYSTGTNSHAEGGGSNSSGAQSHAEGYNTTSAGNYSHAEGYNTTSTGIYSHAEGNTTSTTGDGAHAEGLNTQAYANYSHAEGNSTYAGGIYSHAEGGLTTAQGQYSHAEGYNNGATGQGAHAEGNATNAGGNYSHAEGQSTSAGGTSAHAEGYNTYANGNYSHAEGQSTNAQGTSAHAEGYSTSATGNYSHAEGQGSSAQGDYSHAEGYLTTTTAQYSHAEGFGTSAQGLYSHAEGSGSKSTGAMSHAEGRNTLASGIASHAEGYFTTASGQYSHAQGLFTIATGVGQVVIGQYNITSSASGSFIIGNGSSTGSRSNLFVASGSEIQITGSIISTQGFTGSLQGTSSWANNSITSSYSTTASYAMTASTADAFTIRGNLTVSGSTTIGDATTDSITFNAATMSLGNGTGILNIDSNTLYVDGANNRVGVGTTSPSNKLDVNGTIGLPYITLDGGTSAFGLNYFTTTARQSNTGIAASFICNGTPSGYGYVFSFKANQAANQLLIVGDNTTTSHIFSTDAYSGGAGWPLKFRVANTGESWGSISDLMTLTPNQRVGIGTSSPAVKLHVQSGSGAMGFPYEIAAFERNGDNKFGIFSSANAFTGNGVSVVLGYTNVLNNNSNYPGFEFQYVGGAAQGDNFIRYNYIERQSDGQIIAAVADLLNIYADGKVTINNGSSTSKLGIGTSSPSTTLHVFSPSDTLVAHFEGVNGSPFQIRTTDEPPTAGYDSPIGSICNNGVSLWVKTGSFDQDWAPIVYEKGPMPERTFTGIDLSNPYYITFPGIYEVTASVTEKLYFPDPTPLDGQSITVVNTDSSNNIDINVDSYAPYLMGQATQMSTLDSTKMYKFVSIGGKWRGMRG